MANDIIINSVTSYIMVICDYIGHNIWDEKKRKYVSCSCKLLNMKNKHHGMLPNMYLLNGFNSNWEYILERFVLMRGISILLLSFVAMNEIFKYCDSFPSINQYGILGKATHWAGSISVIADCSYFDLE